MKLYFAPMEGITSYTFRNLHSEMFGGCSAYYAPFITPSTDEKTGRKMLRDILPENNHCGKLIVQFLSNNADAVLNFEPIIEELGYDEINLNFGCPFSTVVKKGKGASFLKEPERLDNFLEKIFEGNRLKISVKTRIGFSSADELEGLIEIYNKYPLEKLIIHPRTRADFYKGEADREAFKKAVRLSKNKVCYNGDICSDDDINALKRELNVDEFMIGRGALKNPAVFRKLKGGETLKAGELTAFTEELAKRYVKLFGSEVYTLRKMKEIWMYVMTDYPEETKMLKALKKSAHLNDFLNIIKCIH